VNTARAPLTASGGLDNAKYGRGSETTPTSSSAGTSAASAMAAAAASIRTTPGARYGQHQQQLPHHL